MIKTDTSESKVKTRHGNVYDIITAKICDLLEKGTVPWQCPWKNGKYGQPRNFVSTRPYQGFNTFWLGVTAIAKGYRSPFWLSYKQANDLGGHVRKGEESAIVLFYKPIEVERKMDSEESDWPEQATPFVLRYTPVFNTEQCDGLKVPTLVEGNSYKHHAISNAEDIITAIHNPPNIQIRLSNRASYSPTSDEITVPEMSQFKQAEEFYSTIFHELGHNADTGIMPCRTLDTHESRGNPTRLLGIITAPPGKRAMNHPAGIALALTREP